MSEEPVKENMEYTITKGVAEPELAADFDADEKPADEESFAGDENEEEKNKQSGVAGQTDPAGGDMRPTAPPHSKQDGTDCAQDALVGPAQMEFDIDEDLLDVWLDIEPELDEPGLSAAQLPSLQKNQMPREASSLETDDDRDSDETKSKNEADNPGPSVREEEPQDQNPDDNDILPAQAAPSGQFDIESYDVSALLVQGVCYPGDNPINMEELKNLMWRLIVGNTPVGEMLTYTTLNNVYGTILKKVPKHVRGSLTLAKVCLCLFSLATEKRLSLQQQPSIENIGISGYHY